mgnify:FL=1
MQYYYAVGVSNEQSVRCNHFNYCNCVAVQLEIKCVAAVLC